MSQLINVEITSVIRIARNGEVFVRPSDSFELRDPCLRDDFQYSKCKRRKLVIGVYVGSSFLAPLFQNEKKGILCKRVFKSN